MEEEVANRLKMEQQYWHLDDMDQWKVGLEVVFKGIESDQRSKRNPRDKSTKILGVKVTATFDKKGAIKGAKNGRKKGAFKGAIASAGGGPLGVALGAAKGGALGAVIGTLKGGVRVSFSRSRSHSGLPRRRF